VVGKLIQRMMEDVEILNTSSKQFFILINDICHALDLASMLPIIPSNSLKCKKSDVASEKVMPGSASHAVSKRIDDSVKRARSISQRIQYY